MANRRKKGPWLALVALLVVAAGVALVVTGVLPLGRVGVRGASAASAKAAGQEEKPAVAITVGKVEIQSIARNVEAVGTFQGFEEAMITPKVGGRVVKIYHDVQDVVQTGDVLLEIDPTDYQLAVEEARKAVASELAKIGRSTLPADNMDPQEFLLSLPNYRKAVNVESNAASRRERAYKLYQSRTLTKEDFDQVNTDYEVAKATRQQVDLDAFSTLASARQKQALLATAQQHLADTRVEVPAAKASVPPAAGQDATANSNPAKVQYVVAERLISEGEMVSPNMAKGVFRLVINQTLKLFAAIPERYSSQVRLGQEVAVRVESYPDKVFQGKVSRISPVVDRLSRTFQIEVLVPNEAHLLKSGGFAKLAVLTQADSQAMTVPQESLVSFAGVNKVFVVRDGVARVVEVAPGAEGLGWVEVTAKKPGELSPGDQVVRTGHTQLAEGVRVRVREKQ